MASPPRVTIRDVSRRAGVSPTTVSHALNGRGRVGEQTRARIVEAARELGYVANPIARALKSGRTMTIAAELPATAEAAGLESAFLRDVLVGAAEAAMESGYLLAIAGRTAAGRQPLPPLDGVLVVDPVGGDPLIEDARRQQLPVVTVSRFVGQPAAIPAVSSDYVAGVRGILDQLDAAGYRRPALLTTRQPFAFAEGCLEGYREWTGERELEPLVHCIAGHPSIASGQQGTDELLALERPPDAIIAVTEPLAVGTLAALTEHGVRVPGDVGLASVSDSERLRSASVPVTALDLFPMQLGRRATALLLSLVDGEPSAESVELPTRLHLRASTRR